MKCTKLLSTRQFLREFHYSRLWFTYSDWRSLVYIPWFPYKWQFQFIHLLYRWVLALYFLSWLIVSIVQYEPVRLYVIFLTNWGIIAFVIYLIMAALSVTAKFITVHACKQSDYDLDRKSDYLFKKPRGCCGYQSNMLSWYQMIQWACFVVGGEFALSLLILYWTVIYRQEAVVDGVNVNTHLTNGIISVVDVWLTGMPVSLLHFVYPASFAAVYASFTGVYFAANGTGASGERYIYPVINYGESPGLASAIVILVCILFVPVVHLFFYAMFLARFWLVYAIYGRFKAPCLPSERPPDATFEMEALKEEDV